jgi:hypothetical protein
MSREELMKPRYKVIADYPFNKYHAVGKIIIVESEIVARNENGYRVVECEWEKYPAIFKPLEWWEHREEKDMPEYVKLLNQQDKIEVHKAGNWNMRNGMPCIEGFGVFIVKDMTPATETEYLNFKNKSV